MKKICIIILLLFSSCSSNKMILDYLIKEKKSTPNIQIKIIKDKYELLRVLKILKGGIGKNVNPVSGINYRGTKYLNENDYLKLKFESDTLKKIWKASDFKNLKVDLINYSLEYFKTNKVSDNVYFYSLSEEILINEKRFFFVSKSHSIGKIDFTGVLVFKKINKIWQIVEIVETTALF